MVNPTKLGAFYRPCLAIRPQTEDHESTISLADSQRVQRRASVRPFGA